MAYLDVSPMISSLRSSPETFEFSRGSLHHIPSRHRFQFDGKGQVRVDAHCNCACLMVSKEQETNLYQAFNEWRASYWRPLEINRQFAAHFAPPPAWRRILIALTERLHRALLTQPRHAHEDDKVAVPAE
jgi:hypothetical protein